MEPSRKEKIVAYWIECSNEDLESAEKIIFNTHRFLPGMFFLHLALEKRLKAYFVKSQNTDAPLSHNLIYLAERSKLQMDEKGRIFFVELSEYNIETRYPSDLEKLKAKLTLDYCSKAILTAKEYFQWISDQLNKIS